MPTLFGVDIAGIMARELGPKVLSLTLTTYTPGARTSGQLSGGTNPTSANVSGRGWTEDYREGQVDGDVVKVGDRKVCILGSTIGTTVPAVGMVVTIEGTAYRIERIISRDPAQAVWTVQVRP